MSSAALKYLEMRTQIMRKFLTNTRECLVQIDHIPLLVRAVIRANPPPSLTSRPARYVSLSVPLDIQPIVRDIANNIECDAKEVLRETLRRVYEVRACYLGKHSGGIIFLR